MLKQVGAESSRALARELVPLEISTYQGVDCVHVKMHAGRGQEFGTDNLTIPLLLTIFATSVPSEGC